MHNSWAIKVILLSQKPNKSLDQSFGFQYPHHSLPYTFQRVIEFPPKRPNKLTNKFPASAVAANEQADGNKRNNEIDFNG